MLARFDRAALSVEPPLGYRPGTLRPEHAASWTWIENWCFENPQQPFAVARLEGPAGSGRSHLAEALSRHLDGDDRLQALPPGWPRWHLRLSVLLADQMPWRRPQRSDPWDCGRLDNSPEALQALHRFRPRRATLMVADELPPPALAARIAALAPRQGQFRRPVRLLVIARADVWSVTRA